MITARIEVDYLPKDDNIVASLDISPEDKSNVSKVDGTAIAFNNYKGFEGFHLAKIRGQNPSDLTGKYKYYPSEGYKGYCSRELSDSYGNINKVLSFSYINGVPNALTVFFDKVSNVYAKSLTIYNDQNYNTITINNTVTTCYIDLSDMNLTTLAGTIYVSINTLNRPYTNIKITKMTFGFTAIYDDDVIANFKCATQLMDTTFNINPTVIEQYAEISFKDKYSDFKNLAKDDLLNDNLTVRVYINDDLIGTYLTESWNIAANDLNVQLNCNDPSRLFEYINIQKIPVQDRNISQLLDIAFGYTDYTYDYLDEDTENICNENLTLNSWVYVTSLTDFLKKICLMGMLRIYWYKDKFIVARCY